MLLFQLQLRSDQLYFPVFCLVSVRFGSDRLGFMAKFVQKCVRLLKNVQNIVVAEFFAASWQRCWRRWWWWGWWRWLSRHHCYCCRLPGGRVHSTAYKSQQRSHRRALKNATETRMCDRGVARCFSRGGWQAAPKNISEQPQQLKQQQFEDQCCNQLIGDFRSGVHLARGGGDLGRWVGALELWLLDWLTRLVRGDYQGRGARPVVIRGQQVSLGAPSPYLLIKRDLQRVAWWKLHSKFPPRSTVELWEHAS